MLSNVFSGAVLGLETIIIKIETDVSNRGLPGITVVGLADKAISEAKERVLSALNNSDLPLPEHRTIINLSPADVPKEGSLYDLPIALGILTAYGFIPSEAIISVLALGELSLNGNLMPIRGAMPLALLAKKQGLTTIIAPYENRHELSVIQGITIYCARSLQEVVLHLTGQKLISPLSPLPFSTFSDQKTDTINFSDVIGQQQTKRVLEIAAAGFHNVLLKGPPGTGKTMLARAFPTILPPLEPDEVMEVSRIYSISGLLNEERPLVAAPPFRSPHHTISKVGLIGGGPKPMPGEISLSHRGVLFLDEMAEFARGTLESLRQPLEDGFISISRASGSAQFPTRFILVAATNPCPCGNSGNIKKRCVCTPSQIINYRKKLSAPILDRIDLHIFVPMIPTEDVHHARNSNSTDESAHIQKRVCNARQFQRRNLKKAKITTNGEMSTREVKELCEITPEGEQVLKKALDTMNLSLRAYFKTIKVSQTIANLAGTNTITDEHIGEALQFRVSE